MAQEMKQPENRKLVEAIHKENRRRGWTLDDLADHLGISRVYMSKISRGTRQLSELNRETQRKLADYLGISLVELLLGCGGLELTDLPEDISRLGLK